MVHLIAVILEESHRHPSASGSRPREKTQNAKKRNIQSDLMERIHAGVMQISIE